MEKLLERIRTKPGYKYLAIIAIIVIALDYLRVSNLAYEVKHNPNLHLICDFKNGSREVPKDKIVTYIGDEDVWSFTNGWAQQCTIVNDKDNK